MRKVLDYNFKNILLLFLLILISFYFQEGIIGNLTNGAVTPHFVPIIIIFIAFYSSSAASLFLCCSFGLLIDFNLAILVGPAMISSIVLFTVFSILSSRLFISSNFVLMFCSFFGVLLFLVIQNIITYSFKDVELAFGLSLLYDCLLSALASPLVFMISRKYFLREN